MAKFDKWIEGVAADATVRETAEHSVRVRLAAVQHYLPLAAERASEDVEYVHQLRVHTRRSMAALKLYSSVLPTKKAKWLRQTLREVRRAAGTARDLDVLAQRHKADSRDGAKEFRDDVRRRRRRAQRPIAKVYRKLRQDEHLHHCIEEVLEVGKRASEVAATPFGQWASSRLKRIVKRFFKDTPSDLGNLDSLHCFRIQAKELRYAMELLAPAFPTGELRKQLYPAIEQLQELLGQIHDHAVARERFSKWVGETASKKEANYVRKLLVQEDVQLQESLDAFGIMWTPEFQSRLRKSFKRLIKRSATNSSD